MQPFPLGSIVNNTNNNETEKDDTVSDTAWRGRSELWEPLLVTRDDSKGDMIMQQTISKVYEIGVDCRVDIIDIH